MPKPNFKFYHKFSSNSSNVPKLPDAGHHRKGLKLSKNFLKNTKKFVNPDNAKKLQVEEFKINLKLNRIKKFNNLDPKIKVPILNQKLNNRVQNSIGIGSKNSSR